MSSADHPTRAGRMSRRDFLKLMAAAGSIMAFAPFIEWDKFLPNNKTSASKKTKIEIRGCGPANVHAFPVNSSEVVIYPKSDDPVLNKESVFWRV